MDFLERNKIQKDLLSIKQDDQQGRCVIATTKIPAGTLIIDEEPVIHGPKTPTTPICLTCYHPVSIVSPRCPECGWPFCSNSCAFSDTHHQLECKAFQNAGIMVEADKFNFNTIEEKYDVIYPLRMLMVRKQDPETWQKCMALESHIDNFGENPHYRGTDDGDVLLQKDMAASLYIRKTLRMDVDEKIMTGLYGVFYSNNFSTVTIDKAGIKSNMQMIYILPSLMNHSCVPNIRIAFDSIDNGLKIKIVTMKDIMAGEQIINTYVDNLDPTPLRQKVLKNSNLFVCTCKRCSDPTELDTMASAIRCVTCKKSFCLPKLEDDRFNENSSWFCGGCGSELPGAFAMLLLIKSKEEIETLVNSPEASMINRAEELIIKYKQMFHPNNGLLVGIKMKLISLYGQHPSSNMKDLKPTQLTRKKELCEEVLMVMEKLDYKMSLRRGMAMYELHLVLVMLGKMSLKAASSQQEKEEARDAIKKGINYLERSFNIFKTETTESLEKVLYVDGQKDLIELQGFISTL